MFSFFVVLFIVLVALLRPVAEGYVDIVSSVGRPQSYPLSRSQYSLTMGKVTHYDWTDERTSYQLADQHLAVTQVKSNGKILKELTFHHAPKTDGFEHSR